MKVRAGKPTDCPRVNTLMDRLIDEIYTGESEKVRRILKANYTKEGLKEMCSEKQTRMFVVTADRRIVGFLFGWLFHNVFTVYWIYVEKPYRGKGAVTALLAYTEEELFRKGCYKLEMYAYAENNRFLNICQKLGFKQGILIRKSMFGFKIRNIYKYIGECGAEDKVKTIKIIGEAGQGVKLMSYTLASILAKLGNEVSLNLEYDSAVRSGTISADLIYSDDPIDNPIIDEADVLIKFTRTRDWFPARDLVIDESLCGTKSLECNIQSKQGANYGFQDVAISKFGSKISINMIAMGRILRYIGVNIMLLNIEDLLPPKYVEKNLAAIKYGFNFRDDT